MTKEIQVPCGNCKGSGQVPGKMDGGSRVSCPLCKGEKVYRKLFLPKQEYLKALAQNVYVGSRVAELKDLAAAFKIEEGKFLLEFQLLRIWCFLWYWSATKRESNGVQPPESFMKDFLLFFFSQMKWDDEALRQIKKSLAAYDEAQVKFASTPGSVSPRVEIFSKAVECTDIKLSMFLDFEELETAKVARVVATHFEME